MRYLLIIVCCLQLFAQSGSNSGTNRPNDAFITNDSIKVFGIDTLQDTEFKTVYDCVGVTQTMGAVDIVIGGTTLSGAGTYVADIDFPLGFSEVDNIVVNITEDANDPALLTILDYGDGIRQDYDPTDNPHTYSIDGEHLGYYRTQFTQPIYSNGESFTGTNQFEITVIGGIIVEVVIRDDVIVNYEITDKIGYGTYDQQALVRVQDINGNDITGSVTGTWSERCIIPTNIGDTPTSSEGIVSVSNFPVTSCVLGLSECAIGDCGNTVARNLQGVNRDEVTVDLGGGIFRYQFSQPETINTFFAEIEAALPGEVLTIVGQGNNPYTYNFLRESIISITPNITFDVDLNINSDSPCSDLLTTSMTAFTNTPANNNELARVTTCELIEAGESQDFLSILDRSFEWACAYNKSNGDTENLLLIQTNCGTEYKVLNDDGVVSDYTIPVGWNIYSGICGNLPATFSNEMCLVSATDTVTVVAVTQVVDSDTLSSYLYNLDFSLVNGTGNVIPGQTLIGDCTDLFLTNQSGGAISGYNIDNSGKLEVSQSNSYGEYVLSVDNLPVRFSEANVGTGSQSYNSTFNSQTLSVTSNLDVAVFQTRQFHPYFPGNAQQPEFTFIGFEPELDVEKLVGYYSSSTTSPYNGKYDGVFLSSSSGIVALNIAKQGTITYIPQNTWDDPLDGTGASKDSIDWNNFQVVLFDFLYLGGTTVNMYMIFNGERNLIHSYHHSNNVANTIFDTPSQPLRAEIRSVGGSGSFDFVCGTVSSMGGDLASSGLPTSTDSGSSLINLTTSGTKYALLGIKKSVKSVEHFISDLSIVNAAGANETYLWTLEINPTLSSALSYTTNVTSTLQQAAGDGTITVTSDGYVVASGYGTSRTTIESEISKAVRIGQTIDGVFDEYILSITPMQNGQQVATSINSIVVK